MADHERDSYSNDSSLNGSQNQSETHGTSSAASILDLLGPDDPLHQEMQQLLEQNQEIKDRVAKKSGVRPPQKTADAEPPDAAEETSNSGSAEKTFNSGDEVRRLKRENSYLRARVEELESAAASGADQSDELWSEQLKEYESLLEEKSEVIRTLHQKLQKYKKRLEAIEESGAPAAENHAQEVLGDDLDAVRQELLTMKQEIEIERRQLQEDERAMMDQMREMEMAMSRERVEIARQRSEVQRLHQEVQREIEQAQKDGSLRDRLMAFQRRAPQPATGTDPAQTAQQAPPRKAMPTQQALPNPEDGSTAKNNSGLLRRIFG